MSDVRNAFAKAGLGSLANMFVGLLRNKIIAIYLGPIGLGQLALLQQIQATAIPLSTLGGDAPLVQGLSSTPDSEKSAFLSSALFALIISWTTACILFLFGGTYLAKTVLIEGGISADLAFRTLSLAILASSVSSFFCGILTTVGAVGTLQKSQLSGAVAGLLFAIPAGFAWQHSQDKAIIALYLAVAPLVTAITAAVFVSLNSSGRSLLETSRIAIIKFKYLRKLVSFGVITIITGTATTGSWLLIRRDILNIFGTTELGHFSAVTTLSGVALSLVGTALGSFYLPKFAAAEGESRKVLLISVLKLISPVALAAFAILQIFAYLVVKILFSEEFLPMVPLLRWWALGDLARTVSYAFSYALLAKAHLRFMLATEVIFSAMLCGGIWAAIRLTGDITSAGIAYFAVYFAYLIAVLQFAKYKNYFSLDRSRGHNS